MSDFEYRVPRKADKARAKVALGMWTPHLKAVDIAVALLIIEYAYSTDGGAWISPARIIAQSGHSQPQVYRALQRLKKLRIIDVEYGVYLVNWSALVDLFKRMKAAGDAVMAEEGQTDQEASRAMQA
jgi:hypothetical protein